MMQLGRFMTQFIVQLSLLFILTFILIITCLVVSYANYGSFDIKNNLSQAPSEIIDLHIRYDGEQIRPDHVILNQLEKNNAWIQIVDEEGQVLTSCNVPSAVPQHYQPLDILAFEKNEQSKWDPRQIWTYTEGSSTYIILYGENHPTTSLMENLKKEIKSSEETIQLSQSFRQELNHHSAWVQVLDQNNEEVYSFHRPETIPAKNTASQIIDREKNPNRYKERIKTFYDQASHRLFIVGSPNNQYIDGLTEEQAANRAILFGLLISSVLLLFILILCAVWYSRKFGLPVLHILNWIQNIGAGIYQEPTGKNGLPYSRKRSGHLKRPFKLYKDVIQSIHDLTTALLDHQKQRQKAERMREAWISGLSHDLKTPLSSIVGYAHMLEAKDYHWSEHEARSFGQTIREKAAYMNDLIEDLNLTYQIRNHALHVEKKMMNINELVRRSVIHFINQPGAKQQQFDFQGSEEDVMYPVNPKWFQRIIDNLLANAVKHNPAHTKIEVSIKKSNDHRFSLIFSDNGVGMDQETRENLFHRYYRGTTTDANDRGNGTGLGMAITKQLVHAHGGTIQVISEEQKGTTIILKFDSDRKM